MKKQPTHWHLSRPILFSVGLHVLFVGGIVYAPIFSDPPIGWDNTVMSAVMIDPALFTSAESAAVTQTVQTLVAEVATAQQPIIKADPVETDVKPEAEPIVAKKPASIVKSKLKPQAKTEVKPTKPKNNQPKTQQPKSVNGALSNVLVRNTLMNTPMSSVPLSASGAVNSSAPKVLSQAKPVYSERARVMGLEGMVVVKYDVGANGRVVNINIISATPKNLFERDVKKAMGRWRYEPQMAKNLQVTFYFKLNGDIRMLN